MSRSVALIPGWAEGSWQARKLVKLLRKNDFLISGDPINSDVIIAHSEACFWVPAETKAKLIVLIGPPIWPGRSVVLRAIATQLQGYSYAWRQKYMWYWTAKLLFNGAYILSKPALTFKLLFRHTLNTLPAAGKNRKVVLIRNSSDLFCSPDLLDIIPESITKDWIFVSLSGHHDDLWINPGPYIDLLLKELK